MSKPKHRRWTADQKLKIVLETLQSDRKLAEICRREGISPTQVYQWRRQLLASAEAVFGRRKHKGEDRQMAKLATENQRMKNVVAEITAENLDLKKRSRIERLRAAPVGVAAPGEGLGRADKGTQRLARTADAPIAGDRPGHVLSLVPGQGTRHAASALTGRLDVRAA